MVKQELCASCINFSTSQVIKFTPNMKPTWLQKFDYVENFIENYKNFQEKKVKNPNSQIELDLGKSNANRKILFWGADDKNNDSPLINDAKKAYHNFENHGVVKTNSMGKVILQFKCPQPYNTQAKNKSKPKTYFRHIHFVYANKDNTEWQRQIYTKIVVCKLFFNKINPKINSGLYVIINALPSSYYAMDHIPNSFNLHYKEIKKMDYKALQKWFQQVVTLHYPKLNTYLKNNKIEVYEIPLIVYCAHNKCNASELAIEELMKKGFVNIYEFSGGIKEYRQFIPYDKH
jgi:hypothetical protein